MTSHAQVVTRIVEDLFGRGDLAAIDQLYAPELIAGVRELVGELRTAFADLTFEIDHLIAEHDQVACRWTARGTHRGPFHGLPASGVRATWTGISFYELAGARVTTVRTIWDRLGLLQQLRAALR